ncbi:MAG: hypothetical protein HGN29_12325 [Asgard group archaeon]|nr:hypothetical protein [Asgard group archaeon]
MANKDSKYTGSSAHGWWDLPISLDIKARCEKCLKEKEAEAIKLSLFEFGCSIYCVAKLLFSMRFNNDSKEKWERTYFDFNYQLHIYHKFFVR